jgi:hypothetical protein
LQSCKDAVVSLITKRGATKEGVIANKLARTYTREEIARSIESLSRAKLIWGENVGGPGSGRRGRPTVEYSLRA